MRRASFTSAREFVIEGEVIARFDDSLTLTRNAFLTLIANTLAHEYP